MLFLSIITSFVLGYITKSVSSKNISWFAASPPPEAGEEDSSGQPISVNAATEMKDAFAERFSAEPGYTNCTYFDLATLENYISATKEYLNSVPSNGKTQAIGAYFGVTPENKMTIFLAPVLFSNNEFVSLFGEGENKLPCEGGDDLALDNGNTHP